MINAPVESENLNLHASDIISQINTKQGVRDYVEAESAIVWFYQDYPPPRGRIITKMLSADPPIFKASVWMDGSLVATGHASPEGNSNTLKKVESAAVRRALANAGYSTKKALIRLSRKMVQEGAAEKLGSGKKSQERRIGGKAETNGKQAEPEPDNTPRPKWATPENLDMLKGILAKDDIQWSEIPTLTEVITDPTNWQQWEAFADSGKAAVQWLMKLRDEQIANTKPATPKNAPAAQPPAETAPEKPATPAKEDFLEKIEYTPKMVSTGSATVPETSFLHKDNIGKVKSQVQQLYMEGEKLNTFHMNGSICKMLNAGALTIEMSVDQAVAIITQLKTDEAKMEADKLDKVPF